MKKKKEPAVINLVLGIGACAKATGILGPFGYIHLQGLSKRGEIGRTIKVKDLEGPQVNVLFTTVTAVRALIDDLEKVSSDLEKYEKEIVYVATNNPPGRINIERKLPGKTRKP